MANNHIISIEKPAKLSVNLGRIEFSFIDCNEKHYFASEDISVLILSHHTISLSAAVAKELSLAGSVIIYAGDNYMPVGVTLPVGQNVEGARKPHLQAKHIANLQKYCIIFYKKSYNIIIA
ncbi:MAG: hypothetical protein LBQ47_05600 [Endomicrobium sp.]|jgi:CRISPR/Cas system-associated endonuclease Cas1|nr:hypothetical protein [Endomicrobium sp.]